MTKGSPVSLRLGLSLAVAGLSLAVAHASGPAPAHPSTGDPVLDRGAYLVVIGGCSDCHTPMVMGENGPAPDMSRFLAGHPQDIPLEPLPAIDPAAPWNWAGFATLTAFAGPWGVSVARNITPDDETGLGRWSEAQFVRAMRTGRHQGLEDGREILPPMPWPGIAQMTDEDLHALWSYLRSVPAIHNAAPQSIPAPPPGASDH